MVGQTHSSVVERWSFCLEEVGGVVLVTASGEYRTHASVVVRWSRCLELVGGVVQIRGLGEHTRLSVVVR